MGLRDRLANAARKLVAAPAAAPDRGPLFPKEPSADGMVPLLWDHEVGYDKVRAVTLPDGAAGVVVCCRRGTYALSGVSGAASLDATRWRLVAGGSSWDLFTGEGHAAGDATPYAARSQGAVTWIGGPCSKPSVVDSITVSREPLSLTIPAGVFPPARLSWRDIDPGNGAGVGESDTFDVDYMGILWSSGKVYDSTWRRKKRYRVDMKSPTLLEGWRKGLLGLKPGGMRLIIVPPWLGYGEEEIEETVPSGETLLFLVQRPG